MIPRLEIPELVDAPYLEFLQSLAEAGFKGDIRSDHGERRVQATDNSVYEILPQAAVYPRDIDDIVCICELSQQPQFRKIVLTPRGGGTGTNGQSLTDGIVVDLSRHMNAILEINVEECWARVQSGVVKDQLNAAIAPHGLFFAPELSTSNRATIGGMVNTDASGQGSCRYGKTRDHVLELKTVLLDGSVIVSHPLDEDEFKAECDMQTRSGLIHRVVDDIRREHADAIAEHFPKLNRCLTGYDLAHIRDQDGRFNLNNILCGSEGTLGFVTEVKINLLPTPACSALIIVKYGDFEASLRDALPLMEFNPTSIETIDSTVLQLAMKDFVWSQVEAFFADDTPVPVAGINLVEFTADSEQALTQLIDPMLKQLREDDSGIRIGFALAKGKKAVDALWSMRKRAVGLLGNMQGEKRPIPFVEDTAVPPQHLADFIMEFRAILDRHQLRYGMFGHVDAGVLHVRPAIDMKDPQQEKMAWKISDEVAALTQRYHGLLWGEHGKGVRSSYAPQFFGDLYPQLQRIKASFDPFNQLNPGKIASPDRNIKLLQVDEVRTRGSLDRQIPKTSWTQFDEAVHCNGNGACFNWNYDDPMCPSWKVSRLRTHSPKGRAALVKEWLRLLAAREFSVAELPSRWRALRAMPTKIRNSWRKRRGEADFSHEVYESMAACLACKSCTGQCPIKVDVPEFRSKFLAHYHTRYLRPLKDYLVGSLEFLLPAVAHFRWIYNPLMGATPVRWLLKTYVGFVDAPAIHKGASDLSFAPIANKKFLAGLTQDQKSITVVIVQDAFTRYFETDVVREIVICLRKLGFNPALAPFRANGKPLHVHGFLKFFRRTAKRQAALLNTIAEGGVALVGIDPSMTLTYRAEYSKYLNQGVSPPPVQLLQEWLNEHLDHLRRYQVPTSALDYALALHCTEKTNATASSKQWQNVFAALGQRLNIVELGCCGMAGTYGHEARNRDSSARLFDLSWRGAIERQANLMATGYSCRSQSNRECGATLSHPLQEILRLL